MQKIALQRVVDNADDNQQRQYLCAVEPASSSGSLAGVAAQSKPMSLQFLDADVVTDVVDGLTVYSDQIVDSLCWTIVGICKLTT